MASRTERLAIASQKAQEAKDTLGWVNLSNPETAVVTLVNKTMVLADVVKDLARIIDDIDQEN